MYIGDTIVCGLLAGSVHPDVFALTGAKRGAAYLGFCDFLKFSIKRALRIWKLRENDTLSLSLSGYTRQYTHHCLISKELAGDFFPDYSLLSKRTIGFAPYLRLSSAGGRDIIPFGGMRNMAMSCPYAAETVYGHACRPHRDSQTQRLTNIEMNIA